ncbi:MAG: XRE family transcriptional regulator [Bacillus sp. (in: firmicutes)]
MFVGEKLTNMRILHGFSRQELANNLGITEQAVWQYENGYTTPGLETINKMRDIFQIKAKFFYSPDRLKNQISENNIAYRATERSSRKKAKSESVHLEYLHFMLDFMEKWIAYPSSLLVEIRNQSIELQHKNEMNGIAREETIEQIALLTRELIGLNKESNDHFLFLLEKSGAFIFEKSLGTEVDAYSVWSNQDRPFIMLSNRKKSSVRRNFDLAHELGHLLLHHRIDIFELEQKEFDQVEKEANYFASSFLLPKKKFLYDLKHIQRKSNPKSYIDLKKKWHVSIAAMGHRTYSLKEMDYQQYRYFNASLNKYQFRNKEPLDNELVIMRPGKIRHALKFLVENKLCSIQDLINHTNFEVGLLSYLFNIETDFFKQYMNQPKVYEFTPKV